MQDEQERQEASAEGAPDAPPRPITDELRCSPSDAHLQMNLAAPRKKKKRI